MLLSFYHQSDNDMSTQNQDVIQHIASSSESLWAATEIFVKERNYEKAGEMLCIIRHIHEDVLPSLENPNPQRRQSDRDKIQALKKSVLGNIIMTDNERFENEN